MIDRRITDRVAHINYDKQASNAKFDLLRALKALLGSTGLLLQALFVLQALL